MSSGGIEGRIRLRRPRETDYPVIAISVDDWWDGKVVQGLLPRLWFRHFAGTSWIVEPDDGRPDSRPDGRPGNRPTGFLVGFRSVADPTLGVIQAVGVNPNQRRRGIGRMLVEAFLSDARTTGIQAVETVIWPGNRRALPFLAACGFEPDPDGQPRLIHGVPAIAGYDFGTEDRARFRKSL
ncbi:MAG: GNAT family N-acetyltransferase [Chloroflexi bacterium]|nr:GNAT family N-acetyltransferase [Chloroflexota bacterium]